MYILTSDMRKEFVNSLNYNYSPSLLSKQIDNRSDIEFAATHLYAYGTPFVNRGVRRQQHYTFNQIPQLKNVLYNFINEFYNFFHSHVPKTQSAFDIIHEELCNLFLNDTSNAGLKHTYGNAQKMVNILFKYCACFSDAPRYAKWFKYCHMAIDRYTYNGYRLPFYRYIVLPSLKGSSVGSLQAWSSISNYKDYKNIIDDIISYISSKQKTYNDYLYICDQFSILTNISKLKNNYILTPFEAEFFIWIIAKECSKRCGNAYVYNHIIIKKIKALL